MSFLDFLLPKKREHKTSVEDWGTTWIVPPFPLDKIEHLRSGGEWSDLLGVFNGLIDEVRRLRAEVDELKNIRIE